MKIKDLLKMEFERVDRDAAPLLRHVSAWTNIEWPFWQRKDDSDLEAAGFGMAWIRKHGPHLARPSRRVWTCGFVMYSGNPCALIQSGGREGDDDWSVFIFERDLLSALLCRIFDRASVRLIEKFTDYHSRVSFIERQHDDIDIGNFWGSCLNCAWRGNEDLDDFGDTPERTRDCPAQHR